MLIGLLSLSILTFFLHLNCFKKFKLFSCLGPAFLFHSPLCRLSCLTIVTTILLNSVSFSMLSPLGAITMGISFSRGDMLFGFSLFSELGFAHLEFVGCEVFRMLIHSGSEKPDFLFGKW